MRSERSVSWLSLPDRAFKAFLILGRSLLFSLCDRFLTLEIGRGETLGCCFLFYILLLRFESVNPR